MNLPNSKEFIISPFGNNSHYLHKQVDNLVPTETPPLLALSKTPLEPLAESLESPKVPSEISSIMLFKRPLREPLNSPKFPYTSQSFSETDFCKELSLMKHHVKTTEIETEARTNSEKCELVKRKTN